MGYQTSAIVVFTFALTIKKIMSKNTFGRDQNFQKVFKHNQLIFKRKCEQAFDYRRLTKKSTLILNCFFLLNYFQIFYSCKCLA